MPGRRRSPSAAPAARASESAAGVRAGRQRRERALELFALVGRPSPPAFARAIRRRQPGSRPALPALDCGHRGQAIDHPGDRHLVPFRGNDPERIPRQRLRPIEVAELALDHAQIGRLNGHDVVVAGRSGKLESGSHHLSGAGEVARHLERRAQHMLRAGTALAVGRSAVRSMAPRGGRRPAD